MRISSTYKDFVNRKFIDSIAADNYNSLRKIVNQHQRQNSDIIDDNVILECIRNYVIKEDLLNEVLKMVDVNLENKDGENLVFQAAKNGNIENVKNLIKFGADIEYPNSKGQKITHLLSKNKGENYKDILRVLFSSGANNTKDGNRHTPLDYLYLDGEIKFGFEIENILFNNEKLKIENNINPYKKSETSHIEIRDYEFIDYYKNSNNSGGKYYFQELTNELERQYFDKFRRKTFTSSQEKELEL